MALKKTRAHPLGPQAVQIHAHGGGRAGGAGVAAGLAPATGLVAAAACEALIAALIDGSFPLRLPVVPLSSRPSLLPIEA